MRVVAIGAGGRKTSVVHHRRWRLPVVVLKVHPADPLRRKRCAESASRFHLGRNDNLGLAAKGWNK